MRIIKTKDLSLRQKRQILELWNKEYPINLQYKDFSELEVYLNKLDDQNHFLLLDTNDKIKGWYSDFIRDEQRWFLAILDSEVQGRKFGTRIMELAKKENEELNGWVINSDQYIKANGEIYRSPIEFYKKNGFQVLDQTHLKTDQISAIKVQWLKTGFKQYF